MNDRWEYRVLSAQPGTLETTLDAEGRTGWELISVEQYDGLDRLIFKRPKGERKGRD